jgi:hypothetical protein
MSYIANAVAAPVVNALQLRACPIFYVYLPSRAYLAASNGIVYINRRGITKT